MVEESVILLSDMLGLIFVRVICSNLWVICAPIFSKCCDVFLETYCVVGADVCLGLHLPCQVCSLPCHSWEGSETPGGWLGGPAEWDAPVWSWGMRARRGGRARDQPRFRVGLFLPPWNFQCCSLAPPDSFCCQVSHSVCGFISGSLINYQYSLTA